MSAVDHQGERTDLEVLRGLLPREATEVVDVGCGTGGLARALAAHGCSVLGVEPDEARVEVAREAGGARFVAGVAEALPVETGSVDAVVFNRSLHHVPVDRMPQALAEAQRVLRPGGSMVVLEPEVHGAWSGLQFRLPGCDERRERAAARAALTTVGERFATLREIRYDRVYEVPDLPTFLRRFGCDRAEVVDLDGLRAAFAEGRAAAGYRFTNPVWVGHYRLGAAPGRGNIRDPAP